MENAWTIEVDSRPRRIVQIRGYANRRPDAEVTEGILQWAKEHTLKRA